MEQPNNLIEVTIQLTPALHAKLDQQFEAIAYLVKHFTAAYPPAITSPEVIDAVTVPLPLRAFIAMATVSAMAMKERDMMELNKEPKDANG